jgi:hypothetical protein
MPLVLCSDVQRGPFAIPVERQAVLPLVRRPYAVEVFKLYVAGPVLVEEAEDDLVLGIRFREEILEDAPVLQGNAPLPIAVGDLEQYAILVSLDLVLLQQNVLSATGNRAHRR